MERKFIPFTMRKIPGEVLIRISRQTFSRSQSERKPIWVYSVRTVKKICDALQNVRFSTANVVQLKKKNAPCIVRVLGISSSEPSDGSYFRATLLKCPEGPNSTCRVFLVDRGEEVDCRADCIFRFTKNANYLMRLPVGAFRCFVDSVITDSDLSKDQSLWISENVESGVFIGSIMSQKNRSLKGGHLQKEDRDLEVLYRKEKAAKIQWKKEAELAREQNRDLKAENSRMGEDLVSLVRKERESCSAYINEMKQNLGVLEARANSLSVCIPLANDAVKLCTAYIKSVDDNRKMFSADRAQNEQLPNSSTSSENVDSAFSSAPPVKHPPSVRRMAGRTTSSRPSAWKHAPKPVPFIRPPIPPNLFPLPPFPFPPHIPPPIPPPQFMPRFGLPPANAHLPAAKIQLERRHSVSNSVSAVQAETCTKCKKLGHNFENCPFVWHKQVSNASKQKIKGKSAGNK